MMTKGRITSVRNAQFVKVKRCCASCEHRIIRKDGSRVCHLMELIVEQKYKCKQWQMSKGMRNAGKGGGVVRDKDTKEIVID